MLARERIRRLEEQLAVAVGRPAEIPIPADLSDFEGWCNEYMAVSVFISSRAHQGVKKSEFEEPSLIYRALLALRDRRQLLTQPGSHKNFKALRTLLFFHPQAVLRLLT